MEKIVTCLHCGNEEGNVAHIPLLVSMDASSLYGIRKADFAKKSTQIYYASWDRTTIICGKCGRVSANVHITDTPSEDTILECMRDLAKDYEGLSTFKVDNQDYTPQQMVQHLTINDGVGREFRRNLNKSMMMFLMSFAGAD